MWAPPVTHCPHCAAPLDALASRRGASSCGAASCRHQAEQAHTARLKEATEIVALALAETQLKRPPAKLVWLEHNEPELVPLRDEERQRQRAYLESVVADGIVIDRASLAPDTADDSHPQGGRLCGQCRGRCCQLGAGWNAFIDLTLLQRWRQEQAERSLADAVEAYMALLPSEHVEGACLYQTASGCSIPRERRAEICNGFACAPLQEVQRAAAADATAAVVAVTFHKDQVERAAILEVGATHVLGLQVPTLLADLPVAGAFSTQGFGPRSS